MRDGDVTARQAPPGSGIVGVVLAGGLSRRMGREKAFVTLAGRPLVAHALERLAGQVDAVALSANGDPARFADWTAAVLPDQDPARPGPLAGIEAALAFADSEHAPLVATAPVDAPFLPPDWVGRLQAALRPGDLAAVACTSDGLQPVVAVWRTAARPRLRVAMAQGTRAVRDVLTGLPHTVVAFDSPGDEACFFNVNTPADRDRAEILAEILARRLAVTPARAPEPSA